MDIVDRLITRVEMQGATGFIRQTTAIGSSLKSMAAVAAIGIGVDLGSRLIDGLTKSTLETEKMTRRMNTLFIGPNGAQQGFALASRFATRFRRDLADVQTAELTLAEKGVQPTSEALKEAMILSDRSGKDMAQTAGDVAQAWLGNREVLRQYGTTLQELQRQGGTAMDGLTGQVNAYRTALEQLKIEAGRGPGGGILGLFTGMKTFGLQILTKDLQAMRVAADRMSVNYLENEMKDPLSPQLRKAVEGQLRQARATLNQDERIGAGIDPLKDPKLKNSATGMAGLIRQFVGSGAQIGPIGIKPSELPNMNLRYGQAPIRVQVDGRPLERAVKSEFNAMLEQLNRHGVPLGANH